MVIKQHSMCIYILFIFYVYRYIDINIYIDRYIDILIDQQPGGNPALDGTRDVDQLDI